MCRRSGQEMSPLPNRLSWQMTDSSAYLLQRQYVRRLIESTNICMDSIAFPGEKTKCVAAGLETGEVVLMALPDSRLLLRYPSIRWTRAVVTCQRDSQARPVSFNHSYHSSGYIISFVEAYSFWLTMTQLNNLIPYDDELAPQQVHMWDMRGKSMTRLYQTGQRSVLSLVASPDGRVLIAGHEDGTVCFAFAKITSLRESQSMSIIFWWSPCASCWNVASQHLIEIVLTCFDLKSKLHSKFVGKEGNLDMHRSSRIGVIGPPSFFLSLAG